MASTVASGSARSHFLVAAQGEGFPQCDVLFGWDIQDEVIGSLPFSNWEIGFGDIIMRPDLGTFAVVPWEEGSASVICDFHTEQDDPLPISPRFVLRRVVEQAGAAGYAAQELATRLMNQINIGGPAVWEHYLDLSTKLLADFNAELRFIGGRSGFHVRRRSFQGRL